MSFNSASFEFIGGAPGLGLWRYRTADNIASQSVGSIDGVYFNGGAAGAGTTYKKYQVRAGDIILASCGAGVAETTAAVNSGLIVYVVPQDWDVNGASVIPTAFNTKNITTLSQGGD
jgi:hypothetical protein